mgnify:FL=1
MQQCHFYVFKNEEIPSTPPITYKNGLEIKEITTADQDEIDELTKIDEWNTSKLLTLRKLEEGWHVYIAKDQGRIVASQTVIINNEFEDPAFGRKFKLASNEAYYWRSFCMLAFRGKGIFPVLGRHCLTEVAQKYGRNNGLTVVSPSNKSMRRAMSKFGFKTQVGSVGFIEIFAFRLQYLWGRKAFKETRKRFFIQNIG